MKCPYCDQEIDVLEYVLEEVAPFWIDPYGNISRGPVQESRFVRGYSCPLCHREIEGLDNDENRAILFLNGEVFDDE